MSVRIVLLCEDKQTDTFIRRFLSHRNFGIRDIHSCEFAGGRGSGEQLVRKQFPQQLRNVRGRRGTFLIVVTDADTGSTSDRWLQLRQECGKHGIEGPKASDPVVIAVPRRNIETWFEYLGGREVDETKAYPRLGRERDCKPLADRLHETCHRKQRLDDSAPPSLRDACRDYPKLKR